MKLFVNLVPTSFGSRLCSRVFKGKNALANVSLFCIKTYLPFEVCSCFDDHDNLIGYYAYCDVVAKED